MDRTTRPRTALVVDDLPEARRIVGERLIRVGFDLDYAEDGIAALDAFGQSRPDLIVTDRQMPRLDGIGLLRRIREISNVPVLMISAFASISDCEEAMRVGANRYLQFRLDLDRIGSVACDLIGEGATTPDCFEARRVMTATEARSIARQELRRELQRLLFECRGNIAEMARRMDKDRSTIRYHLRRLGMLDEEDPGRSIIL